MFNLKNIVSKITDRGREPQPNSPGNAAVDDSLSNQGAEGFLCPTCMNAYPSPEELQAHYEEFHISEEEASSPDVASAGFISLHQEVGERYKLQRQGQSGQSVSQERLSAEIQGITNVSELQKSLMDALESKAGLQLEKESLEQRTAQLARVNAAMKAFTDEEQGKSVALKERLKIVEAQLAHRESIDDAAVLRQELVQVQRVMDEMTRERERERDALQTELQQLKTAYIHLEENSNWENSNNSDKVAELATLVKKEEATKLQIEKQAEEVEDKCKLEKLKNLELLGELETLKKNHNKLLATITAETDMLKQSQEQVQLLKLEATSLKSSLHEKSVEAESYSRDLHNMKSEQATLLAKVAQLSNAQTLTSNLIKDKDERLAKLAADLKRHASEGAGAAKAAVQQLAEENEARLREIEAVNAQLIAEKLATEDALAKATNDCSIKDNNIYELSKKIESCSEKIHTNEAELKEGLMNLEEVGGQLQASVEKCATLNAIIVDLQNASHLTQQELKQKEEEIKTLQDEVHLQFKELKVAGEEKNHMEVTRASLETDIFEMQKAMTVLETESQDIVQDLRDEIMTLQTNLTFRQQNLQLIESDLENCQQARAKDQADHNKEIEKRDEEREKLRLITNALIEEMTKSIADKQQEIDNLMASQAESVALHSAEIESLIQSKDSEKASLEDSYTKVQAELDNKNKEAESLKAELITLEATLLEKIAARDEKFKHRSAELESARKKLDEVYSTHEKALAEKKTLYDSKCEELKSLQLVLDEVTGDKLVLEAHLQTSQTEHKTLMEKYYASSSDNETQRRNLDEFRRRCEDSQSGLHELGRENQILRLELEKLLGRKWTEDSDVASCHLCHKEFSLLVRKHHCRNCGQIFCNECSAKNAPVANNKKPVRVCDGCYNELSAAM